MRKSEPLRNCSFTLEHYRATLESWVGNGVLFCRFTRHSDKERVVILRHDVDFDLDAVVPLASLEYELSVTSTYFLRLTSDYYNLCSPSATRVVNYLLEHDFEIGLHFDAALYSGRTVEEIERAMENEARLLSAMVGINIEVVSFHRPGSEVLGWKPGMLVNAYAPEFLFGTTKYISDSAKHWREGCMCMFRGVAEWDKIRTLQVLVHPEWWTLNECSVSDRVTNFLRNRVALLKQGLSSEINSYVSMGSDQDENCS